MTDIARALRLGIRWMPHNGTFNVNGTHQLSSSTHGYGCAFRARDTNPITHLGFNYSARTGTPPTYRISIQGLDVTNGRPDGTVKGGGSPASATFTPPADTSWNGTWQYIALSNSYTPTLGEELFFWVDYSTGTVNTSNCSTFVSNLGSGAGYPQVDLYPTVKETTGSYSKSALMPIFGVRTASTRYGNIIVSGYNTRSASTVGVRQALKFSLPSGIFSSYKISHASFLSSLASAVGKNPLFKIWDSDGNVMQSVTLDTDVDAGPSSSYSFIDNLWIGTPAALTPGSVYYAGLQVADATLGGVILNGIQLNEAADRDAWGGGTNMTFSTFDGSTWTDDTTVIPFMQLLLSDITASSGSSGNHVIGG